MSNLVDFLPILQKLPNPMLSRGKRLHQGLVETYGGMIEEIEKKLDNGIPVEDCLAKSMVQMREEEQLDDLDMAILASAFMIGGVETVRNEVYNPLTRDILTYDIQTASIMQWFSALIPAYPEIQKRAQEEIDRVVGRDRLPTVEDEINLPYCHAIVKEVNAMLDTSLKPAYEI
jgi:cytochrome P450